MNAMRETELNGWRLRMSSGALQRAMRLAAVTLALGCVMSAGIARAQDDEEDTTSFEDRVIKNIMSGLGGTNMENQGIDYRERSPLVVPPKIDLPPPDASAKVQVPNWPKDPDVAARNAAAAGAGAKYGPGESALTSARPLTPAEMAPKRVRRTSTANDVSAPGDPNKNIVLSPKQLGYEGGLFKNMFGGGNKSETAEFKGEPSRGELTQPPVGYQTPSPNYAYGTGPKEILRNAADINPVTGKY
jgi:hypothetical protein